MHVAIVSSFEYCHRVMAREMALVLVLVAAALLQTGRTETTAPGTQDTHSINGRSFLSPSVLNLDHYHSSNGASVQSLGLHNYLLQLNSKLETLTSKMETLNSNMATTQEENLLDLLQNLQNDLTYIINYVKKNPDILSCGGPGWRRVVYLDMTDSSTTCPSGWKLTGYSKRSCGRASTDRYEPFTCDSAIFPVSGGEYTRVCGRMKAYHWGSTNAFYAYIYEQMTTIDSAYVDGVSVTHGSPQQHIWTFAAGRSEGNPTWDAVCSCDANHDIPVPPFVGEDYFCESVVNEAWEYDKHQFIFHSTDTLWDGKDCLPSSTCCSRNNPPYFIKHLPTPTTDSIEARICLYNPLAYSNLAVELVELYVQ